MPFTEIDHVQLAMPPGREEEARGFYAGVLGMREVEKPPALAMRGGVWFASGRVHLHLGVENEFRAAKKAHPALRCGEYAVLLHRLREAGYDVMEPQERFAGSLHAYVHDPFGNRIELIDESVDQGTV